MKRRGHLRLILPSAAAHYPSPGNAQRQTVQGWGGGTDPLTDPRWPGGWWILPFALGGLVEATALTLWLIGYI
jgi:hypothetical protein